MPAEAFNFVKKQALAQVFSFEFCEIFKNNFGRLLLKRDDEEKYDGESE